MSENRFVAEQVDVVNEDETEVWDVVFDTENTYAFMVRDTDTASDLCGLLNEQQATITKLKELNDDKGKRIISLIRTNKTLKEENEQLRQSVEYWQKKYEEGTETFQID